MSVTLTQEQEEAQASLRRFLAQDQEQIYTVHGLAGCGKTTVLAQTIRPTDHLVCFTNKAASVARSKGVMQAKTAHSLLFSVKVGEDKNTGESVLSFKPKLSRNSLAGQVIYLDECSMISGKLADDLLDTGAHIAAFGDPGQLPPVMGEQFFINPDFTLKQVHRQALDSPIIRQAHAIRNTGRYAPDGDDFQVVAKVSLDQLAEADVVLAFMRRTCDRLNGTIRAHLGYNLPYPMRGEKLLCLKNAHAYGVYNGVVYEVARNFTPQCSHLSLVYDGGVLHLPRTLFTAKTDKLVIPNQCLSIFSYGYVLSVHKFQGSEADKIVLIDECRMGIRREWLYTGVTRAAKSIIIQG